MGYRQDLEFLDAISSKIDQLRTLKAQELINMGDSTEQRKLILSLVLSTGKFDAISAKLGLINEYDQYKSYLNSVSTQSTVEISELIADYRDFLIVKIINPAQ